MGVAQRSSVPDTLTKLALKGEHSKASKRCGQATDIAWIPGSDNGRFKLQSGCDDEGIDSMRRRQLQPREHVACLLSDGSCQLSHANPRIVEKVIDS